MGKSSGDEKNPLIFVAKGPVVHDFHTDDKRAAASDVQKRWHEFYERFYPTATEIGRLNTDIGLQMAGIDRSIYKPDGNISIEEKLRWTSFTDVMLEYKSSVEYDTPGWVEKPLKCEIIAYAIQPLNLVYIIPFKSLQVAWFDNKDEWIGTHPKITGHNNGYTTVGCGVPICILSAAGVIVRKNFWNGEGLGKKTY
jgi:hypothetical protein